MTESFVRAYVRIYIAFSSSRRERENTWKKSFKSNTNTNIGWNVVVVVVERIHGFGRVEDTLRSRGPMGVCHRRNHLLSLFSAWRNEMPFKHISTTGKHGS